VIGHSQPSPPQPERISRTYLTITLGGARTIDANLQIRIKHFNVGLGYGVLEDDRVLETNGVIYARNDRAIYGVAGYRWGNLVLGVKAGSQKNIYITGVVNGVNQHLDDVNEVVLGVYGGVHLSERARLNLGYDTFNKLNVGVTFGL